jgi:hypothetical protein
LNGILIIGVKCIDGSSAGSCVSNLLRLAMLMVVEKTNAAKKIFIVDSWTDCARSRSSPVLHTSVSRASAGVMMRHRMRPVSAVGGNCPEVVA